MKKIFFILLILSKSSTLFCHEPFSTRMLYFLVDTEEQFNAVTNFFPNNVGPATLDILEMLITEVPFVVTSSLLHNFSLTQQAYADFLTDSLETLIKKYNGIANHETTQKNIRAVDNFLSQTFINLQNKSSTSKNISLLNNKMQGEKHLPLLIYTAYDKDNWLIFKINKTLFLFLPKNQYGKLLTNYTPPLEKPQDFSNLEKELGLAIDHLPLLSPTILNQPDTFIRTHTIQLHPQELFVPKRAYANQKNIPVPSWTFFFTGHGVQRSQNIAELSGISLDDLKKTLDYFEKNLITKLVIFFACYFGGKTFLELQNPVDTTIKEYSFGFINFGARATPVTRIHFRNIFNLDTENFDITQKNITLTIKPYIFNKYGSYLFYKDIYTALTTPYDIIYSIPTIAHFLTEKTPPEPSINQQNNIISYKIPGMQWNSLDLLRSETVKIDTTLTQTRTQALDITHFFKTNPKQIFFEARDIPFPLIFTRNQEFIKFPTMLPLHTTSDALYTLISISAPQFTLGEIFNGFIHLTKDLNVMWYIEKIEAQDITVYDVIIRKVKSINGYVQRIFLKKNKDDSYYMNEALSPSVLITNFFNTSADANTLGNTLAKKNELLEEQRMVLKNKSETQKIASFSKQKDVPEKIILSHIRKDFYTLPEDLAALASILT